MIDLSARIVGAETVVMRLATAPAHVRERVRTEVDRLGIELQRKVKESKLTGQVLKVRTGRLRRSINLKVTEDGNSITGSVGTNVAYARRFEIGGTWSENVKAHVRRNREQIKAATYTTKDGKTKVGSKGRSSGAIPVKAHTRSVTVKPRPFLAPVLEEMRNPIRTRLAQAVAAGFKGGK